MWNVHLLALLSCLAIGVVNSRNILLDLKAFMQQHEDHIKRSDLPPVCDLSATSELNLCWLCDAGCQEHVNRIPTSEYANPTEDYFAAVTDKISQIMQDLDSGMRVLNGGVTKIAETISVMDYTNSKDTAGFATANTAIWAEGGRFAEFKSRQCDTAFMVISPDDAAFSSGGVIAVSNMMAMCKTTGSGLAKYYRTVGTMANVVAHEIGHQMGIYHDGTLNSAYTNSPLRKFPDFADEFEAMDSSCTSSTPQNMVMDEVPINVEHKFSACSKAYYSMWKALAIKYSMFYDDTCLKPSEKRRSLKVDARGIEDSSDEYYDIVDDIEEGGVITEHGIDKTV